MSDVGDDRATVERAVHDHAGWVFAAARRRVRDAALAEDVTQAVFLLFWRKRPMVGQEGKEGKLAGWLYRAVRYCSANALRLDRIRQRHEREAAMQKQSVEERAAKWSQVEAHLEGAMDRLSEKDRLAIVLRFYRAMGLREVGEAMGIGEDSARKRVDRAVEKLRGILQTQGVTGTSAGLSVVLVGNVVQEVPARVVEGVMSALRGGGGSVVAVGIAKGAAKMMALVKAKVAIAVVAGGLALIGGAIVIRPAATGATASASTRSSVQAEQSFYYGRVVSPEGKPVAGARVYLVDVDNWTSRRRTLAVATSDASGRFKLAGVPNASSVLVQAEGFGLTIGLVDLDADETDPAEIEMAQPAEARVRLAGPDGAAVAGVQVAVSAIQGKRLFSLAEVPEEVEIVQTTDANGDCVFKGMPYDGIVRLEVRDDRYAQGYSSTRAPVGEPQITVLKLGQAAEVSGRVVLGKDGTPASGVCVRAQGTTANREGGGGTDITDAQGHYRIKRIPPGEYNIGADLKGALAEQYTAAALERVMLEPGQRLAGQDMSLVSGGMITGRALVQGTGEPVPGLFIGLQGPARPRSGAWIQRTQTGPDGKFAIRVPPGTQYVYRQSQLPMGLEGESGQDGRDVKVEDRGTAATEFAFRRSAAPSVGGRVLDAEGKPVPQAHVMVEQESKNAFEGSNSVKTDAKGRFLIPSAANGARVSAAKGKARTEEVVVIGAGNRELTLTIRVVKPTSSRVVVCTADGKPVEGATVGLNQMRGLFGLIVEERRSNVDGVVVFRNLESSGKYHVMASKNGYGEGQARLKLRAGEEAEVRVTLPKADNVIAGGVVDDVGKPIPDIEVTLNSGASGRHTTRTDTDGRFRFDGIVVGDSPLVYVRWKGKTIQATSARSGQQDVVIVVPATLSEPSPLKPATNQAVGNSVR